MWVEREAYRAPQDDWVFVPTSAACLPFCPSDGHRVRLDHPGDNQVEMYAESRVRALHHALSIRWAVWEMASFTDLCDILKASALNGWAQEVRAFEGGTYVQAGRITKSLAGWLARHVNHHMQNKEVEAYGAGYSRLGPEPE